MAIWNWLKPSIDRGIEQGVRKAFDEFERSGKLAKIIDDEIAKNPWFQFILAMKNEMLRVDPRMTGKLAWNTAAACLRLFLAEEKIRFGDAGYDWSKSGAIDLIHAMEIDHWEAA